MADPVSADVEVVGRLILDGPGEWIGSGAQLHELAALIAARVRAEAAGIVGGLCHWSQDVQGVQAQESHEAFHFGYSCPYEAAEAVLRGEPDPRRDTVSDSDFLARVRAEAVAAERQATYERLLDAAQGAMNEERRLRLVQFVVNNFASVGVAGSVPVATPTEEWRTTTGRPLGREPRSRRPITRHGCGCVTGWDDVHEECVLRRCSDHGPVATPTEPAECWCRGAMLVPHQLGAERCDHAASPVPAGQPVDEVVCPSCGTRIRARMSDAQPAAQPAAEQLGER